MIHKRRFHVARMLLALSLVLAVLTGSLAIVQAAPEPVALRFTITKVDDQDNPMPEPEFEIVPPVRPSSLANAAGVEIKKNGNQTTFELTASAVARYDADSNNDTVTFRLSEKPVDGYYLLRLELVFDLVANEYILNQSNSIAYYAVDQYDSSMEIDNLKFLANNTVTVTNYPYVYLDLLKTDYVSGEPVENTEYYVVPGRPGPSLLAPSSKSGYAITAADGTGKAVLPIRGVTGNSGSEKPVFGGNWTLYEQPPEGYMSLPSQVGNTMQYVYLTTDSSGKIIATYQGNGEGLEDWVETGFIIKHSDTKIETRNIWGGGYLWVKKVNEKGEPLPGARFELTLNDEVIQETFTSADTSDSNGDIYLRLYYAIPRVAQMDLAPNPVTYRLRETIVPNYYTGVGTIDLVVFGTVSADPFGSLAVLKDGDGPRLSGPGAERASVITVDDLDALRIENELQNIPPYIPTPPETTDPPGTVDPPDEPGDGPDEPEPPAPPQPTEPGQTLEPEDDGSYLLLDEDGVPLGRWTQNDDGEWIFEEFPPLGSMPQTGWIRMTDRIALVLMAAGLLILTIAILRKKQQA